MVEVDTLEEASLAFETKHQEVLAELRKTVAGSFVGRVEMLVEAFESIAAVGTDFVDLIC